MPPAVLRRLVLGDRVSVLGVDAFCIDWLKEHFPSDWHRQRWEGFVNAKSGSRWKIRFDDNTEAVVARAKIKWISRPEVTTGAPVPENVVSEDSSDDEALKRAPENPMQDSSDEEPASDEEVVNPPFPADHDDEQIPDLLIKEDGWKREDGYAFDCRAAAGFTSEHGPSLKGDWDSTDVSLFEFAKAFLPIMFLTALAAKMQAEGAKKLTAGNRNYVNWTVSLEDVLQFLGVWMYMLAFPQSGDRSAYWKEPAGGYGPRHRLSEWLGLGANGTKGEEWFNKMMACLELPEKPGGVADDPFKRTRWWWESLRAAFWSAVNCSWLMVLDESMVQWQGRGMPGLMVVLRKPTPIGLELHTLCCAVCGILFWFEVYEGQKAMDKMKYVVKSSGCVGSSGSEPKYPKSVALTMRMMDGARLFGSGRVLIADSWFGSALCAAVLWSVGVFSIMNVKTAHKNYPKDAMLEHVGEIKGKSKEAREQRRARRGATIAFTQKVSYKGRSTTLLAGGHNRKVPLLLITTCHSMLPGETHTKTWKTMSADGTWTTHKIDTTQTIIHQLYRQYMNIVDLHNKFRQGVVSMAEVWGTFRWDHRHFAEGLGFWEVNVFKALIFFFPKWKMLPHGNFRKRLAWEMMTLGKYPFPTPADEAELAASATPAPPSSAGPSGSDGKPSSAGAAPLPGACHKWEKAGYHQCSYCSSRTRWKCITCEATMGISFFACGQRSGRECQQAHADGTPAIHSSFTMSKEGKEKTGDARRKRSLEGDLSSSAESLNVTKDLQDDLENDKATREQQANTGITPAITRARQHKLVCAEKYMDADIKLRAKERERSQALDRRMREAERADRQGKAKKH